MRIFDRNDSRIIKVILNFLELAKDQLSSSIISSIPFVTRVAKTIFDHTHPSIFLSTLNFWFQPVKNTKVVYFIALL